MQKSQAEVGFDVDRPEAPGRSRIERARDEMGQEAYDELIAEALRLISEVPT